MNTSPAAGPREGAQRLSPTTPPSRESASSPLPAAGPAIRGRRAIPTRTKIREQYDGLPGALTGLTGVLTGHELLAGRLFRPDGFDVRGCRRILDAACGNGRYTRFLLRHADADALLTTFDLSARMLRRARQRLKSDRVSHAVADLTRMPYADGSFDAIVCGWVIEHLPDPRLGLRELARVLAPRGKLLLMCTENTFLGWVSGRLWNCRTFSRAELRRAAAESGLAWRRELWFTDMHQVLKMGGIIAELGRQELSHG